VFSGDSVSIIISSLFPDLVFMQPISKKNIEARVRYRLMMLFINKFILAMYVNFYGTKKANRLDGF
jgi:hypothetical protein